MSTILCLAHFCDKHGPMAILVTEAVRVGCASCNADSPSTPPPTRDGLSALADLQLDAQPESTSADGPARPPSSRTLSTNTQLFHMDTPPESPRAASQQTTPRGGVVGSRSSYSKTSDSKPLVCDNCDLTLPKRNETLPPPKPGKTTDSARPTLRSRIPYERVGLSQAGSPSKSEYSDAGDSDHSPKSGKVRDPTRNVTPTSDKSSSKVEHAHYLDYTSAREPLQPLSFSLIRQATLRTLSCETLLPSSNHPTHTVPPSPYTNSSYSTSSSGGPIFFGDPQAGYTTAYTFYIRDPTARGLSRRYALMALSTYPERLAINSFKLLEVAFQQIAAWIKGLAEQELERKEAALMSPKLGEERREWSSHSTPTSAFLTGRGRGPIDTQFSGAPKDRSLADISGYPDIFFELHRRFVLILAELRVQGL